MAIVTCVRRGSESHEQALARGLAIRDCHGGSGMREGDAATCAHIVTYEGAVLGTYERNGYDDSDFYAVVYDADSDSVRHIEYGTTRGWTYHNGAGVDATDEAKAAAAAVLAREGAERLRRINLDEAVDVAVGKRVRVVRGRKVPKGTEGTIGWLGDDKFSFTRYNGGGYSKRRIGLDVDGGERVWLAAGNVEVIEPAQYLTSEAELRAKVEDLREGLLASGNFVGASRSVEAYIGRGSYHDHPSIALPTAEWEAVAASLEAARPAGLSADTARAVLAGLTESRRSRHDSAYREANDYGALSPGYADDRMALALEREAVEALGDDLPGDYIEACYDAARSEYVIRLLDLMEAGA